MDSETDFAQDLFVFFPKSAALEILDHHISSARALYNIIKTSANRDRVYNVDKGWNNQVV